MSMLSAPVASPERTGPIAAAIRDGRIVEIPCCRAGWLARLVLLVDAEHTLWFDEEREFEEGTYRVVTCGGAWRYQVTGDPIADQLCWAVSRPWIVHNQPPYNGYFVEFIYKDENGDDAFSQNNEPVAAPWHSQAAAERATCGCYAEFYHYGGHIGLRFWDQPYGDNRPGNPSPIYALYRMCANECPSLDSAHAHWTGGSNWAATLVVRNNDARWPLVADFSLAADGASSVAPSANRQTIPAGGVKNIEFTWSADSPARDTFVNGACEVADTCNLGCGALYMGFAPVIQHDRYWKYDAGFPYGHTYCGDQEVFRCSHNIKNSGNADTVNLTGLLSAVSGAVLRTSFWNCSTPEVAPTIGHVTCQGGTGNYSFYFTFEPGATSAVFSLALSDGTTTFPAITFTIGA